jgi:hypothetical protein
MFEQAYPLGYVVYLAEVFLPGIGLGELLNAWKKDDSLIEKVAFAFGLGLAFDTVVIMVRTSGFTISGFALLGIDQETIYLIVAVGLIATIAALLRKKGLDIIGKPKLTDLVLLILVLFIGSTLILFFEKYLIFPAFDEPDYAVHVQIAQSLISGTGRSVPQGLLYYGVHFQLASAMLLVGGEGLVTAQRTMAILVSLSPILVYTVTRRLFSSGKVGLVTTLVYSLTGTVWFNSVLTTGLYADFFGILATLFFIVTFLDLTQKIRSLRAWVVFSLALVAIYFSHYSSITVFPALLTVALIKLAGRRPDARANLAASLVAVAPGLGGFALFPTAVFQLLASVLGAPGVVIGGTALSGLLSSLPALSYMALEVSDDVAFVLLLFFTAIYVYKSGVSRKVLFFLPLAWLISLFVASFWSTVPERFALEALVPLTLMAGFGFSALIPSLNIRRKKSRRRSSNSEQYLKAGAVLVILLIPLVANSWEQYALTDSTNDASAYAQAQRNVYSAMNWLENNTPSNSTYLSVSDWRFMYTGLFFGRTTSVYYMSSPAEALSAARRLGARYVIVTLYYIGEPLANPNLYPWNTFKQSANLSLVYTNDDVRIFKIV